MLVILHLAEVGSGPSPKPSRKAKEPGVGTGNWRRRGGETHVVTSDEIAKFLAEHPSKTQSSTSAHPEGEMNKYQMLDKATGDIEDVYRWNDQPAPVEDALYKPLGKVEPKPGQPWDEATYMHTGDDSFYRKEYGPYQLNSERTFYHGTTTQFAPGIEEKGLLGNNASKQGGNFGLGDMDSPAEFNHGDYVHLGSSPEDAYSWAKGVVDRRPWLKGVQPVVVKVTLPEGTIVRRDNYSSNGTLVHRVPRQWVTFLSPEEMSRTEKDYYRAYNRR